MPRQIQAIVVALLILLVSVFVAHALAAGDYEYLVILLLIVPVIIGAIISRGYEFFLAFGLICPFAFPIPFMYQAPFLGLMLAFCFVKFVFNRSLDRTPFRYQRAFNLLTVLFFGWVVIRYCMNPVLPNIKGFGANVTGFRAYLNYGLCFVLVLLLPLLLPDRTSVIKLFRWIGGVSLFFILVLVPFAFSKSFMAGYWLQRLGLFVTTFDNGWLRLVVLPGFGLNVLLLSLVPNLVPASKWIRGTLAGIGLIAIVLGGNRSTLLMALIMVLAIFVVRRRILMATALVVSSVCLLGIFQYVGERLDVRTGVGFLRVLSLGSQRIARESGAAETVEWRMIRWKRAMEEIRANPVFGKGYGGLENAWLFTDWAEFEEATVEIALASGGIHNGYLSAAYSLGIPALLLFIVIIVGQSLSNFRQAQRLLRNDPIKSEIHSLVLANLAGLTMAIYVGIDLNTPTLWLYLILGVFLTRPRNEDRTVVDDVSPVPRRFEPRPLPA